MNISSTALPMQRSARGTSNMTTREINQILKKMTPSQLEHFKDQLELKTLSYQLLGKKPARPELLAFVRKKVNL